MAAKLEAQQQAGASKGNAQPVTKLPSISALLNTNDNSKMGHSAPAELSKQVFTISSSNSPLPGMVLKPQASSSNMQQNAPFMGSNTYAPGNNANANHTRSESQLNVPFPQQPGMNQQFLHQHPAPQYRSVKNFSSHSALDMNRNTSPLGHSNVSVPIQSASGNNLSIPIGNSNSTDPYKNQASPFSQSRNFSGTTRNTSTNQVTPISAATTMFRQNSRSGYTPMSTVFSQVQDMSTQATPINRTQFSNWKSHSESFSSSQLAMNSQAAVNSRKHFRSLPVIYQQQRLSSPMVNFSGDVSNTMHNGNNGNLQQINQDSALNGGNDALNSNSNILSQQYQIIHQHPNQQQLLYQYPKHYMQVPNQQERVSSPMYIQQMGAGGPSNRVSFSNYNGFKMNLQQPLTSQTPPLLNSVKTQEATGTEISPKRTHSNSSNISETNSYNNEIVEVEVETETPVKRIPRPRNAFILFRQHYHRLIFKEQTEKLASQRVQNEEESADTKKSSETMVDSFKLNSSVSKTIGFKWKNLPTEERKHWLDRAEKEKTEHHLKYPDYKYVPRRKKGLKK